MHESPEQQHQSDELSYTTFRHAEVRKRATTNYLNNAQKKIKIHNETINDLLSNFSTGDYVGIVIHKVDRTNLDSKLLPAIILEKKKTNSKLHVNMVLSINGGH